jgi:transcriptional regulator with XRE-family HTH domain
MLRVRRERLGLSMRETARRIGISPGYLVALEHGRNPSTGRPPMPSPPILASIGQVLGIELATLLDVAGAPTARSAHLLLYQTGPEQLSALDGARRAFAGRVDAWLEVVAPRSHESERTPAALAEIVATADWRADRRVGLIFGAGSNPLRSARSPEALLRSEATWEDDVAAACRPAFGAGPAANVCVYREADVRGLARVDPLTTALGLIQTHPHVALQDPSGAVTTGPAAVEAILVGVRPAGIGAESWAALATAAGVGFQRETALARAQG